MSAAHTTTHLRRWVRSLPPIEWVIYQVRSILISTLALGPVPAHIAFVMDGNRRYARQRALETVEGHNLGFEALARVLEICYKSGVKVVTIYAFSIENFKRGRAEVDGLMDMAKTKLVQMAEHGALLDRYGARINICGDLSLVRSDVLEQIERAVNMTKHNNKKTLNVCFPYTSREEISHSIRETVKQWTIPVPKTVDKRDALREALIERRIREQHNPLLAETVEESSDSDASCGAENEDSIVQSSATSRTSAPSPTPLEDGGNGERKLCLPDPEKISSSDLDRNVYTADAPPLDLLIRTSGVYRLSDFMLWQCHEHTDIRFLDVLWPQFGLMALLPVLLEWQWKRR
ncbi:Undecaprenyl diphosphate synthase [Piedraia hortae CBS 480.64]|uniref:Alkyl transferase n=1 Tax=Piedraia hortae CBS 480.64 TaxID=1314780 RepID=A0A6A7C4T1_9PEZI|nr:Undecaprenyl diphosphate synthase [Piedraia hortae CBS 480.64]